MRAALLITAAVALLVTACSDSGHDPDQPSVTVAGAFRGSSADAFAEAMGPFTERTGIRVDYIGSSDLTNDIVSALSTGAAPDVALLPQPGFMAELTERTDALIPLPGEVVEVVDANYSDDAKSIGEVEGVPYGVVYKISPKSLVWYPPPFFEQQQIEPPATLAELGALVEEVEGDVSPWCFTMFAFDSTGWIVTDWIEDFLLRQAGTDVYDAWVEGEHPFDSPEVRKAMETFEELVLTAGRAFGGPSRYLRTQVQEAQAPMFDDPASCLLHRQAGFAENWLPDGLVLGASGDTDVFLLPPESPQDETRVLVGGDTAVMFSDTPEVRELMKYLATPESGETWAREGGYTGPHNSVTDLEAYYPDEFDQKLAALVAGADVLRFDGSDMMPASFAARSLLVILTAWVSGEIGLNEAVAELDEDRMQTGGS